MRIRHHAVFPVVVIGLVLASACAKNPEVNATPQAKVAHYAAPVIDAVASLQKAITSTRRAVPQFAETADKLTAASEKLYTRSGQLQQALRAYDAAMTLDLRKAAELEVHTQIVAINLLLSEAFNVRIEESAASSVSGFIAKVAELVATLSAEIAKVRMGSATPPPAGA